MAKDYEITIDRFDGGISDDPRFQASTESAMVRHFNLQYSPKRLKPNRSFVSDMNDGSTSTGMKQYLITDIVYNAPLERYYAIGKLSSGTTGTYIFYKAPTDANWTVPGGQARTIVVNSSASADTITLVNGDDTTYLGISNGVPLTFTGTTGGGLTNGTIYYAGNVAGTDTFKLYTNVGLTLLLDITSDRSDITFTYLFNFHGFNGTYHEGTLVVDEADSAGSMYMGMTPTLSGTEAIYQWRFDRGFTEVSGYTQFTGAITYTNMIRKPRPIVAPDANIYFGGLAKKLIRLTPDQSSPVSSDVSSVLPDRLFPRSFTNYGNYLAIALAPGTGTIATTHSRVFLYDMINLDPIENIDWGDGSIFALENIGGTLIGVSDRYTSNYLGNDKGSMVIRQWSGGTNSASTFKELFSEATGTITHPLLCKANRDETMLFYMKYPTNSAGTTFNDGVWALGRRDVNSPLSLSLAYDTSQLTDSDGVQFFNNFGNFTWFVHSGDGSISRTADTEVYAYTSSYDSQIFSDGYQSQLEEIELTTEPLPASSTATVKYRTDGASSWTTALTMNTTAQTYHLVTRPPGDEFPKYHEIQFQITSTGGAVPLKLRVRRKVLNSPGEDE